MNAIQLLKQLEKYPLFTANDVSKLINKSQKYVKTLLYRLSRKGLISRIERGKYTVYEDSIIFASYISIPSYLSIWTALRYYNLTQQQPVDLFVMSPVKRKDIQLREGKIRFIKTKYLFGYKKERYSDFDIFIAEKEKAIIDSLAYKIPIENISEALSIGDINFKKLADYAKKTKNSSLIKRIGYLLEKSTGNSFGLKALDNNYVVLDSLGKKKGRKNAKWKLIINL